MAHLVNFLGTDNIEGIMAAQKYYGAGVCGYSVMATEHSTTTIYGRDGETNAFNRFLSEAPGDSILSVVIDSYDTFGAIKILGTTFKNRILERPGKLVVRPDSGDPVQMSVKVVEAMDQYFGSTVNAKGFKVLNPKVGVIYGDGIDIASIDEILKALEFKQYAASNIIFGSGGALIQKVNRDTQKFAIKCSAAKVGGEWIDVFKDPITDTGKMSKRGKLALVSQSDEETRKFHFKTVTEEALEDWNVEGYDIVRRQGPSGFNFLETVFEDGEIKRIQTWDEIKESAKSS